MTDRLRLRATFDDVADLYDRIRPGYPAEIIAALGIQAGTRILEIGCGTGQLTVPLVELGADVTAVELGPHLAAIAAAKTRAEIIVADFDSWTGPRE
ncbi:MAG TPA: rRNA adenine N-6-methyltransferase family protein, partial [Pseudonocardiaceae bacterium]